MLTDAAKAEAKIKEAYLQMRKQKEETAKNLKSKPSQKSK
jgi:hypothetical protein